MIAVFGIVETLTDFGENMIYARDFSRLPFVVALIIVTGCSNSDEPPMVADVAAAAKVSNITQLECEKTKDGKPGYLCWFKSPQIDSYAASVRIEKGWFGWKKIAN
ncbi:hypothetical protein [Agrobacterium tumefaciens]|uniref:hypothetical protein n=1 Tax=Agrobacterium tumefaciens TaxID=358 RepID=UPI001574A1F3|nr:hypothetical protein [Agrobacterium tumefaciens]NTE34666.1 hypothetical protein [Agrobacterium tumefaciens]NTE50176.1 hypothetical protein [Agrobacterium tumefaciens]